jgi:hypothetical protein
MELWVATELDSGSTPRRRHATITTMALMTRDICPECGAWLILAEVDYASSDARPYRETGTCLIYECPACRRVFERWMRDDEPLLPMADMGLSLRARVAARRHVSEI